MTSRLRHRELLLTLKYSTIEACFSVPMLNLTMPSFPFVIAFAVAALDWSPAAVGLMAALPHACNFVQPPLTTFLRARLSLHRIIRIGFLLSALPWGLVALLPFLDRARDALFAGILVVATLANSVAGVAWSSAIAEVVPPAIAGTYFGRRNLLFGFWTLVTVLAVGQWADAGGNSLRTFGWIFAAAGLARLAGYFFLTRMHFPEAVMRPDPVPPSPSEYRAPLADANYLRLALYVGLFGLFLNLGQPFYPMFLLQVLERGVGDIVLLGTLGSLGAVLTLRGWGLLTDRYGSRPVMSVAALVWGVFGMAGWAVAGPGLHGHLYLMYLVVGGATAGFQLCQFNLMLKLAPARKAPHVAVFVALTSLLTGLGPPLGGWILRRLPDRVGSLFGTPVLDYHVLFAGSMFACLLLARLLETVREPGGAGAEAVWRTMRRMHAFNPLLTLTTAAQLVFTPRGLLGLSRKSVRTLRRQARRLGDVGGEILRGGRQVLGRTGSGTRRQP